MKCRLLHKADSLKTTYIDYALSTFGDGVMIGNEIMYGSCGKIADLVILYQGNTYAVEVKSDADSLYRIDSQIQEYRKLFNYVIVVCGEKYVTTLMNKLPTGVGLCEITNDNSVVEIKKAKKQTSLDKEEMLFSIKTSYLSKIADFSTIGKTADEIRRQIAKKRTPYIQEILYSFWQKKLSPGFTNFMADRGDFTQIDDLSSFSSWRIQPNV